MLLVLQLAMLIGGLYTIHTGKIPGFLIGNARYRVDEGSARFIGLIMAAPLPCSCATLYFDTGMVIWEKARFFLVPFLGGMIIGPALLSLILYVIFRDPVHIDASRLVLENGVKITEEELLIADDIALKTRQSLIFTIMGILPAAGLITCPIAIIQSTKALRLMEQHRIGEEHQKKAQWVRIIAIVLFTISIGFFGAVLLLYG